MDSVVDKETKSNRKIGEARVQLRQYLAKNQKGKERIEEGSS
jgi:hypothetical protein